MHLTDMTPADVTEASKGGAVLIDVREPNEFASERIAGALNFPLSRFDPSALPEGELVLYCAGGVRSVRAAEACDAEGIAVVGHLAGGIRAWMMAGLPVER